MNIKWYLTTVFLFLTIILFAQKKNTPDSTEYAFNLPDTVNIDVLTFTDTVLLVSHTDEYEIRIPHKYQSIKVNVLGKINTGKINRLISAKTNGDAAPSWRLGASQTMIYAHYRYYLNHLKLNDKKKRFLILEYEIDKKIYKKIIHFSFIRFYK